MPLSKIIPMKEYKAGNSIVPPRSPYYTTDATPHEVQEAVERAKKYLCEPFDYRGIPPYAVVIGYRDKKGRVRLLKSVQIYPSKWALENMGGMATMETVYINNITEE